MDVIAKWTLVILLVFTVGCAAAIKTKIIMPDGDVYCIQSKKDALVMFKQKDMEFTIDNRGKIGWLEGLLQYVLAKPDIEIKNKEGS